MTKAKPKLDIDATRERLIALDCGYAAEHLGHLLGEAVRTEVAPHSFLDQLLAVELSAREEQRVKTSLKGAPGRWCSRYLRKAPQWESPKFRPKLYGANQTRPKKPIPFIALPCREQKISHGS